MLLLTLSEGGWYWCCYLLLVRVAGIGVVTYSYRGWLVLVLLLTLSEGKVTTPIPATLGKSK